MTKQNVYSVSLPVNNNIGNADYTYGLEIPPSAFTGGPYYRLLLQGGPLPVADMFVGARGVAPFDFDGSQQPVTVAGQPVFSIPSGQSVWSDPINTPLDGANPLVIIYDAVCATSGGYYAMASGLGSEYAYAYRAGLGGTSNGSSVHTGLTVASGFSVTVAAIETASDISEFGATPPPPPPPQADEADCGCMDTAGVIARKWYTAGYKLVGESGKFSHVIAKNPSGSGINMEIRQITVTPESDCDVDLLITGDMAGMVPVGSCNLGLMGGEVQSQSGVHAVNTSSIATSNHSVYRLRGGAPYVFRISGVPLVVIGQGQGNYAVAVRTSGVGMSVCFDWKETPI